MNPITNSIVKERIRQNNESVASTRERQINIQLQAELNQLKYKVKFEFSPFGIAGVVLGIILAFAGEKFSNIFWGLLIGVAAWFFMNDRVRSYNVEIDKQKQRLKDAANSEIHQEYLSADQRTQREIEEYDRNVKMYAQKVLAKADSITYGGSCCKYVPAYDLPCGCRCSYEVY